MQGEECSMKKSGEINCIAVKEKLWSTIPRVQVQVVFCIIKKEKGRNKKNSRNGWEAVSPYDAVSPMSDVCKGRK